MLGGGAVTLNGGAVHAGGAGNFNLPNNFVVTGTGNRIANSNTGAQTLNLQGVISGWRAPLTLDNMNLTTTNGVDLFGDNSGFTGSVTVGTSTAVFIRARATTSVGQQRRLGSRRPRLDARLADRQHADVRLRLVRSPAGP